jgi:hypothetical protein
VTNSDRKQAIRAIMTETGMKYMAAMRELDRWRTADAVAKAARQAEQDQGDEHATRLRAVRAPSFVGCQSGVRRDRRVLCG